MTLIMSLISQDHAIQVSDRRFVIHEPDGSKRFEDFENKSVIWCHRVAFGYTGIGNLGVQHATDQWLASQISHAEAEADDEQFDQGRLIAEIARRATDYFRGPRIARLPEELRRHAFVGVGWARFEGGTTEPYIVGCHNMGSGSTVLDRFETYLERLGERRIFVHWMGQDLGDDARRRLDGLRGASAEADDFADRAAYVLGETVRLVASENNLVGRGLLITVMPRASIRPGQLGGFLMAGPPMPDQQTFLYVPRDSEESIVYGPTYVCGGTIVSGFRAGPPGSFAA